MLLPVWFEKSTLDAYLGLGILHLISCRHPVHGPHHKGASCTTRGRQARHRVDTPWSGLRHGERGSDSGVANGEYMWRVHTNAKGFWNYSSTLGWSCCVVLRNFLCREVWSTWKYLGTYPCHLGMVDVSLSRISEYLYMILRVCFGPWNMAQNSQGSSESGSSRKQFGSVNIIYIHQLYTYSLNCGYAYIYLYIYICTHIPYAYCLHLSSFVWEKSLKHPFGSPALKIQTGQAAGDRPQEPRPGNSETNYRFTDVEVPLYQF